MNNGHPPFVLFVKPLYDVALRAGFPAVHMGAFLVVLRLTVGHQLRPQATVSVGAIAKATGRSRAGAHDALVDLIHEGVVIEHVAPQLQVNGGLSARVLSLQPDSTRWGKYAVKPDDVPEFLRHDWDVASEQQGVHSGEQGVTHSEQGGVRPAGTEQGGQSEHIKDRGGTTSPPSPPLTQRAQNARRAGGRGAPSAPRQSKGKELPGAHTTMTDGAADPGRAYLYGDDFDDTEVPA